MGTFGDAAKFCVALKVAKRNVDKILVDRKIFLGRNLCLRPGLALGKRIIRVLRTNTYSRCMWRGAGLSL